MPFLIVVSLERGMKGFSQPRFFPGMNIDFLHTNGGFGANRVALPGHSGKSQFKTIANQSGAPLLDITFRNTLAIANKFHFIFRWIIHQSHAGLFDHTQRVTDVILRAGFDENLRQDLLVAIGKQRPKALIIKTARHLDSELCKVSPTWLRFQFRQIDDTVTTAKHHAITYDFALHDAAGSGALRGRGETPVGVHRTATADDLPAPGNARQQGRIILELYIVGGFQRWNIGRINFQLLLCIDQYQ
ncbi:hypothetical protein D3C84_541520 [compost metagenome]